MKSIFRTIALFLLVLAFFYLMDLFIMAAQNLPLQYDLSPAP